MADAARFEAFVREFEDMVYATAVRLVGNPSDAEDVAQTVFLRAFERFASLEHQPSAGGWLKTVTTNLCLNHLTRYRARWRFFSDMRSEDSETEFVDSLAAPDRFDASLAESDYRAVLETAIRKLPDAQRIALVLYHFEDQSYEEIAKKLGVSLSKVKTDIHRARLALKRYLRPELLGEEFARGEEADEEGGSAFHSSRESEPVRK